MSPHIRTMLENAADDGGRPVGLDIAAVRAAGRRATWRQRALVGGGGIAAAAVITSVALLLAPNGGGAAGPATDGGGEAATDDRYAGDPQSAALADALAPLIDALGAGGYEAIIEYSTSGGGASESGDDATGASATGLTVTKDGATGGAIVAEFTDPTALALVGDDLPDADLCAAVPVRAAEFVWTSCDEQSHSPEAELWLATGGDDTGSALAVTLVRRDGSGISVALSTTPFDPERVDPGTPALGALPLTHAELADVVDLLDARAPLMVPLPGEPTAGPTGPEFGPPTDPPPGSNPCEEAVPASDECIEANGALISTDPLVDALVALGLEVTAGYNQIGTGTDSGPLSAVLNFHLADDDGRLGSAAIGVYASLEAASLLTADAEINGTGSATWCAVAPSEIVGYGWSFADNPTAACTGFDSIGADQTVVFVHDEADADAISATLLRADGSVISVSVSQAPSAAISSLPTALPEVPLDRAAILEVLQGLAAGE